MRFTSHPKRQPSTSVCFAQDDYALGLKLVSAVRAEDEFELQKNGIDLTVAEEEIRFEKVVIVLQSQFRKFCGIPG
jgi:hypothetical protein